MKGLTLTTKEQTRLCIMNGVLERQWSVAEAAQLLGVSERHTWRLLAAYQEGGRRCPCPREPWPLAIKYYLCQPCRHRLLPWPASATRE